MTEEELQKRIDALLNSAESLIHLAFLLGYDAGRAAGKEEAKR